MTVIGCVWGAYRRLAERHPGFPPYAWCEAEWERLRKTAPAANALPDWLELELWAAWRRELAGTVVREPHQLTLEVFR